MSNNKKTIFWGELTPAKAQSLKQTHSIVSEHGITSDFVFKIEFNIYEII